MPASLVPALTVTCVAAIIATTITVFLRFYTRIFIQRRFRTDDYFVLFGYVCLLVAAILILLQLGHGIGTHTMLLIDHFNDLRKALRLVFFAQLFAVSSVAVVKIAIAMFFFSLNPPKVLKIIVLCVVIISTVSAISLLAFLTFQCKPVYYFWDRLNFDNPIDGVCLDPKAIYIWDSFFNGIDLATDVVLAVLPFMMVLSMKKLHTPKKFGIGILLSLCIVNIIFPLVRCIVDKRTLYNQIDETYDTAYLIITMIGEPALAISICSIVQLRPLVRHFFPKASLAGHRAGLRDVDAPPTIGRVARRPLRRPSKFGMSILQATHESSSSTELSNTGLSSTNFSSTRLSTTRMSMTADSERGMQGIDEILHDGFGKRPEKAYIV